MSVFDAAMLARFAHKGQTTKSGADYYEGHLMPVMKIVRARGNGSTAQAVALLHDAVEDTFVTEDYLRHFFDDVITDAVMLLTREPKEKPGRETYAEFIGRIIKNRDSYAGSIAFEVKTADIIDHLRDTSAIGPDLEGRYIKAAIRMGVQGVLSQ